MLDIIDPLLPPVCVLAAGIYLVLAVRVSRSSPDSLIAFFLFLIGCLVLGAAFSYRAETETMFGIGRVLSYFAGGFIPVTFYSVYREYTLGRPRTLVIVMLSLIPIATVILSLTNSLHNMIWVVETMPEGLRFSESTELFWFKRIHAPYAYGLFTYSAIALAGRLPTIARAHRKTVILLLTCAALPFLVSAGNNLLNIGPAAFPFTAVSVVLMLPLYAWISMSLRVYRFSPLAYPTVFNHVRDSLIVLDTDGRIVCANKSAQTLLDAPEDALIGQKLWEDFPEARKILRQAKSLELTQTLKMRHDKTYEVSVAPLIGPRGDDQGTVVVCRDVSERRRAQQKLADNEQLIRTLIETSSNGILRFARDHSDKKRYRCIFANRSAENYLDRESGSLVGMPLDKLLQIEPEGLIGHFDSDAGQHSPVSFEVPIETTGAAVWLRIVGEPVGEDFSVTLIDITQRKRNEDKMLADALRDPLTGVLNRRGFEKDGATSVRGQEMGAVLYLDLDHFKSINDRFGHQAGDALLKAFGHRLEFCLRPEDILGRLGGDEFAIVLPGVDVDSAKHVAERLVQTASEAYIIQGQEIQCTASVGIALMPKHGEELWHLISVADQAMYNAKRIPAEEAANDRSSYIEAAIAT